MRGSKSGDPAAAVLLLAMGYDMLSMNATNLPKVKSVIRAMTTQQANELLARAMQMESSDEIREMLEEALTAAGVMRLLRPHMAAQ